MCKIVSCIQFIIYINNSVYSMLEYLSCFWLSSSWVKHPGKRNSNLLPNREVVRDQHTGHIITVKHKVAQIISTCTYICKYTALRIAYFSKIYTNTRYMVKPFPAYSSECILDVPLLALSKSEELACAWLASLERIRRAIFSADTALVSMVLAAFSKAFT